jgi:CDP-glucose 4,6-dehydratase
MEGLVAQTWKGKRVLVTGHTGFKGSWLSLVLERLGAQVCGISLAPEGENSLFYKAGVEAKLARHHIVDIRDRKSLESIFTDFKPEVLFHLAAQPLVRYSYENPHETYEVNVMGTLNVLDMCRKFSDELKAVVLITTDKCYLNKEHIWSYREDDAMGGYDPYSSSKGCCELLAASYRDSYFSEDNMPLIATARAGNVIGGGDWALDRLVPDIVRAKMNKEMITVRSPNALRPWQHVLEPINGYLILAQKLLLGDANFATGWNFGPAEKDLCSVSELVRIINEKWDFSPDFMQVKNTDLHEAQLLSLDSTKAAVYLNWKSKLQFDDSISWVVDWYQAFAKQENLAVYTSQQIDRYLSL